MIRPALGYDYHKARPVNWVQGTVVAGARPAVAGLDALALDAFLSMGGFVDQAEQDMVQGIVDTAVEMIADYTGYEPTQRAIKVKWDTHPQTERYYPGVVGVGGGLQPWIKIPRYPVKSVDAITVAGVPLTAADYETDLDSNPPRVAFISFGHGAIEMDITTGPAVSVDPRFKQAVLALAAYLYENRGCAFESALKQSGAAAIARPLRIAIGGL